eukprot:6817399-Pyramimonas_sp.AAC.1
MEYGAVAPQAVPALYRRPPRGESPYHAAVYLAQTILRDVWGGLLPSSLFLLADPSGSGHALVCELALVDPIEAENIRSLVWMGIQGSGRIGRGRGSRPAFLADRML